MRPIDATAYSNHLSWMLKYGCYQTNADALLDALFRLTQMPTITIDGLRPKGRWLHRENGVAYCSECEMDAVEDGTNFCPECGADMRKEGAFCDTGRN